MPEQNKKAPHRLGLALSGGGYRAAAFHLGTLKKLRELGILPHVDVLSTISGGSIVGAAYCLHGPEQYDAFHEKMVTSLQQHNVNKFVLWSGTGVRAVLAAVTCAVLLGWLLFTSYAPWFVVFGALLAFGFLKYQFRLLPISRVVERAYDTFFFQGHTLEKLPARPLLAIGSSNLQTGRPFTFSQTRMGDSAYEYATPAVKFTPVGFPVARAVTASTGVPFAFTPVEIAKEFYLTAPSDNNAVKPQLVDGGVYDNQGIQKIAQLGSGYECQTVIISDAGSGLQFSKAYPNTLALLLRTVDLFMNRIKYAQMNNNLYRNVGILNRPIAYFSLSWQLQKCIPGFVDNLIKGNVLPEVVRAHQLNSAWLGNPERFRAELQLQLESQIGYPTLATQDLDPTQWAIARDTPTGLTPLSLAQLTYLIQQAENLTELQVKLYCPHLLNVG